MAYLEEKQGSKKQNNCSYSPFTTSKKERCENRDFDLLPYPLGFPRPFPKRDEVTTKLTLRDMGIAGVASRGYITGVEMKTFPRILAAPGRCLF